MVYLPDDHEWQSGAIADEGGGKPVTLQQTDDRGEEEEDFNAIDESVGDDVVCVDIAPKVYEEESEADRASGIQLETVSRRKRNCPGPAGYRTRMYTRGRR